MSSSTETVGQDSDGVPYEPDDFPEMIEKLGEAERLATSKHRRVYDALRDAFITRMLASEQVAQQGGIGVAIVHRRTAKRAHKAARAVAERLEVMVKEIGKEIEESGAEEEEFDRGRVEKRGMAGGNGGTIAGNQNIAAGMGASAAALMGGENVLPAKRTLQQSAVGRDGELKRVQMTTASSPTSLTQGEKPGGSANDGNQQPVGPQGPAAVNQRPMPEAEQARSRMWQFAGSSPKVHVGSTDGLQPMQPLDRVESEHNDLKPVAKPVSGLSKAAPVQHSKNAEQLNSVQHPAGIQGGIESRPLRPVDQPVAPKQAESLEHARKISLNPLASMQSQQLRDDGQSRSLPQSSDIHQPSNVPAASMAQRPLLTQSQGSIQKISGAQQSAGSQRPVNMHQPPVGQNQQTMVLPSRGISPSTGSGYRGIAQQSGSLNSAANVKQSTEQQSSAHSQKLVEIPSAGQIQSRNVQDRSSTLLIPVGDHPKKAVQSGGVGHFASATQSSSTQPMSRVQQLTNASAITPTQRLSPIQSLSAKSQASPSSDSASVKITTLSSTGVLNNGAREREQNQALEKNPSNQREELTVQNQQNENLREARNTTSAALKAEEMARRAQRMATEARERFQARQQASKVQHSNAITHQRSQMNQVSSTPTASNPMRPPSRSHYQNPPADSGYAQNIQPQVGAGYHQQPPNQAQITPSSGFQQSVSAGVQDQQDASGGAPPISPPTTQPSLPTQAVEAVAHPQASQSVQATRPGVPGEPGPTPSDMPRRTCCNLPAKEHPTWWCPIEAAREKQKIIDQKRELVAMTGSSQIKPGRRD